MIQCHKETYMKRKLLIFFLILLLSSLCYTQEQITFESPSAYSDDKVKAFADDLFLNGFLDEAAGEYRRYLFSTNNIDPSAVLQLAEIYRITKNNDGILWLGNTFASKIPTADAFKIVVLQGKTLFCRNNYEEFVKYHAEINSDIIFSSETFSVLLDVSQMIMKKNISSVQPYILTHAPNNADLHLLAEQCVSYKEKNPVAAVLLSAILPGAGRWYTGSFLSGCSSFLSMASLGGLIWYTSYHYGWSNWRPWVFCGIAAFSYTVELYGAGKSAVRYNDDAYRKIIQTTESVYDKLY